jgi:hypothetical protein
MLTLLSIAIAAEPVRPAERIPSGRAAESAPPLATLAVQGRVLRVSELPTRDGIAGAPGQDPSELRVIDVSHLPGVHTLDAALLLVPGVVPTPSGLWIAGSPMGETTLVVDGVRQRR